MRKEQEIPSFHQAVLCLASDVVCSSWIPDGTLHRGLGLEHTPHSSYCGISAAGATPPTHTPFACQITVPGPKVIWSGSADHRQESRNRWGQHKRTPTCPLRPPSVSPECLCSCDEATLANSLYLLPPLVSPVLSLKFARYLSRYFPH